MSTALCAVCAEAVNNKINLAVNGETLKDEPELFIINDRIYVPVRFIAEKLGFQVDWDDASSTVTINDVLGSRYLKGYDEFSGENLGIKNNLVTADVLIKILDDDNDNDLIDYRYGQSGGDTILNDPLILDLRKKSFFIYWGNIHI